MDNTDPPPIPPRPWAITTTTTNTPNPQPTQHPSQTQPWQPQPGTTWNYVLNHPVRLSDPAIDRSATWIIDLFDNPAAAVSELHRRGRRAVAYFSAGTSESWRPDAALFPARDLGGAVEGGGGGCWAGERWVRTGSGAVRRVMLARLDSEYTCTSSSLFGCISSGPGDMFESRNNRGLR